MTKAWAIKTKRGRIVPETSKNKYWLRAYAAELGIYKDEYKIVRVHLNEVKRKK